MQQIFKSLTLSLAAMGNVSIVVLLFFLIFAILGVQVIQGWVDERVNAAGSCLYVDACSKTAYASLGSKCV
jgi:hypothetical protein